MNDLLKRCPWVDPGKPDYLEYHDKEWGVPVHDDRVLFEFLILEAFQAGLSWYTILRRRDSFRTAFDHFDPAKIAKYGDGKIRELLGNPGIIRNRAKVAAAVNNAGKFLEIQEQLGSFDAYIWGFIDNKPIVAERRKLEDTNRARSAGSNANFGLWTLRSDRYMSSLPHIALYGSTKARNRYRLQQCVIWRCLNSQPRGSL